MHGRFSLIKFLVAQGFDPARILVYLGWRKSLNGCETVLEVGCGRSPTLKWLGVNHSTGFDGFAPYLEESKAKELHQEYVLGDVRDLEKLFKSGQFDAVIALDVIEHLTKEDGLRMMKSMEVIARKKVIFFTPSGFVPQHSYEDNNLQEHLSGWEADEMCSYGYQVSGWLGPKSLRGEMHQIKGRPKQVWAFISLLAHCLWTRWKPSRAAAILCVKTKSQ